jgi:DNA-binding transcriptional MerR regulator
MSSYRISELAERSGVPATTLRFYETAGLLSAQRTASGYRTYDEAAVERLAFISSAKLLGLALEEISVLLEAWDGGTCSAVRAQLLPLVDERITDADRRVAELRAFSARLARAKTELSAAAPEGACGPDCGCITTTNRSQPLTSTAVPVALTRTRSAAAKTVGDAQTDVETWRDAPVACTLSTEQASDRASQWRDLLIQCHTREQIPDGIELTFPPSERLASDVAALAAAEQRCCSFFDFALHITSTGLVLTVRAPEAGRGLLADLFGALT